jgi:hypothetical protein
MKHPRVYDQGRVSCPEDYKISGFGHSLGSNKLLEAETGCMKACKEPTTNMHYCSADGGRAG